MNLKYENMDIRDYDEIIRLWEKSEGVGLSGADERQNIETYLKRNLGHSYIAKDADTIVGAVLAGHDGRRGFIHHLAVKKEYRKRGIAKALIDRCLNSLKAGGIQKSHLLVFFQNDSAIEFWKKIGWTKREDIGVMSKNL